MSGGLAWDVGLEGQPPPPDIHDDWPREAAHASGAECVSDVRRGEIYDAHAT